MVANIYYFVDERGHKPVEEFIRALPIKERAKIFAYIEVIKMKRVRLEKINSHFKEELKNREFRKAFELERAKVALAQRIAELREEKHLRQVDLAKKLGVTQQFISQIETGQERNLTLETLIKIARSLGRSVKISFPKTPSRESHLQVA